MIASTLTDVAVLTVAAAFAVVLVTLVLRRGIGAIRVRGPGGVSVDVEAVVKRALEPVAAGVAAVNKAVNDVQPGETPLRRLVVELGTVVNDQADRLDSVEQAVGGLSTALGEGLAAIHVRLDELAAFATRNHPEDQL